MHEQHTDIPPQELSSSARMVADLLKRIGCDETTTSILQRAIDVMTDGSVCLKITPEEQQILASCPVVSINPENPADATSLFVLQDNLLYTRRNWFYESCTKKRIRAMADLTSENHIQIPHDGDFQHLNDCQRHGVEQMCTRKFSILTGGPGTGKTYTIARAVKLLQSQQNDLRIGLAAPTGKAAARVRQSMAAENQNLETHTLHSLLGPNFDLTTFKHNHDNPLPLDWLIVDEASMIDLPLMAKLLDALPPDCRLTLVGDEHQLASVEPGRVFGDLCNLTPDNVCKLEESRRFPQGGEIDTLSKAVNNGQPDAVLEILNAKDQNLIHFHKLDIPQADNPHHWPDFDALLKTYFDAFIHAHTPAEALEALDDCRVLCAVRQGPFGVSTLNAYIRKLFGSSCPTPVMITQNNREYGVSNGDIGVVMPRHLQEDETVPMLWLKDDLNQLKKVPLSLLPNTDWAFASTVHKAQGSECKDIIIVLPPSPLLFESSQLNPLLTREILYTAITRTRNSVHIFGSDSSVRCCCEHIIQRQTGLV